MSMRIVNVPNRLKLISRVLLMKLRERAYGFDMRLWMSLCALQLH
jgi:hypothetical protein